MKPEQLTIKRIIKVNHAGEYGAIRIYKAQIFLAGVFYKDIEPFLREMLEHEIEHCKKFKDIMVSRKERPCLTMWFWSYGGFVLGFFTAMLGRNMIMVCTEAVEHAVHKHMNDQISYLEGRDDPVADVIKDIQKEELAHLHFAQRYVKHNALTKVVADVIAGVTEFIILLSTHGDSVRMHKSLKA